MRFYLLRDIPDDLWVRVKCRAAKEGRNLRYIVLRLLGHYADKGLPPDGTDSPTATKRQKR